jgi:hypothetical protein
VIGIAAPDEGLSLKEMFCMDAGLRPTAGRAVPLVGLGFFVRRKS